ncbi:MAG: hypothetical protein COZ37_05845 [bacterium (Candidatus Ratteibacteria) CG_4_10_14_3_um_filter_41_18]|uniref:Uncharacterized protein n=1 Tax=bacterium (Candidatus Ratteibacteria) CG_4_10_14_3_um_filter_41_18 TaxID=2014287 RepID=A0A2M7M2A3_9BACT|nr:MAG: hypothetical protein AUJ76_03650 [Candidatus Omnitrophica bacterium CG1_02_41_171]PIW74373.1 MAG: hypothetical protein CO004_00995 [bacterium (Candidatus Ratteibacteria) CG_4_8_14_3_um_filter_41_36]PIX76816.1 MAG: hypothetical protein COZ37_05845 [bacterium (Candidatus Ratteibacteria) CG_4_10_14_3_um_filter_41_18]
MKKRKIFAGLFIVGIAVNIFLLVNKERFVKMAAMKLAGVSEIMAENQEVDADTLTIADFSSDIPGVTQEYVEAYKLFLKAKAQDKGEYTYKEAIKSFEAIAGITKNPELKLRSLFLITFCNFLEMNIDEAYKSGIETLRLAKELREGDSRVAFLSELTQKISQGKIESIVKVKEEIVSHKRELLYSELEISEFADELFLIPERAKSYEEMVQKRGKTKKSQKTPEKGWY